MSIPKTLALRLLLPAVLFASALSAHAVALVSNLPGTAATSGTALGLSSDGATDRTKGVGLTMGAFDMTFTSLEAMIANPISPSELSGGIYSSVGGNPGALLAAFAPVPLAADLAPAEVSITTASSFTLLANTDYWFVLDGPDTANNLSWRIMSPAATPVADGGATYLGYRFSSSGGLSWASSSTLNGVRISAVPETSTVVMLAAGLSLIGFRLRRRR